LAGNPICCNRRYNYWQASNSSGNTFDLIVALGFSALIILDIAGSSSGTKDLIINDRGIQLKKNRIIEWESISKIQYSVINAKFYEYEIEFHYSSDNGKNKSKKIQTSNYDSNKDEILQLIKNKALDQTEIIEKEAF